MMVAIQYLAVLAGAAQLGAVINYSWYTLTIRTRQIIHGTCTFFCTLYMNVPVY
jgi:hypothetical protein